MQRHHGLDPRDAAVAAPTLVAHGPGARITPRFQSPPDERQGSGHVQNHGREHAGQPQPRAQRGGLSVAVGEAHPLQDIRAVLLDRVAGLLWDGPPLPSACSFTAGCDREEGVDR